VIDLSGLTVDQLQQRVQALPPHTAVYFAPAGAPAGRVRTARDLLKELSELANAPVFVNASTGLDTGAIGGAVTSPESSARDIATQIDRLLAGVPAAQIGFELPSPPQVQLDWRAMRRWNIPSRRVPSNSGVLYRPPGLWEAYPTQVIAGLAVFAMLSGLIAALLIERRRRLLAELQARRQLNHLAQLSRGAALGALSAALAHEINQPLAAILANAETAELLLDQTDASAKTALRESIAAICEDNHRASAVLERLRAWIANAPGDLQPCTLNPLIDGVARMLATELQLRHTELQLSLAPGLPQVWADRVQIQQVVLNLVVNALDALQTMHPPQCRIVVVSTAARDDGQIEATVSDNGCGLPSNERDHLFEPFVSTKPNGLGVGLAISHSIIERHQGRLWVETPPEAGTRFHFTLKAVSAAAEGGV
jgi:signal transduction histidine kinase